MRGERCILSHDLGTSSDKAAIVSLQGERISTPETDLPVSFIAL